MTLQCTAPKLLEKMQKRISLQWKLPNSQQAVKQTPLGQTVLGYFPIPGEGS